jgi:hypothetical protein
MHIDMVQGKVVISQVPMIEKIVDGVTGKATSPVEDRDLDHRTPEMDVSLSQEEQAVYRSKIASCFICGEAFEAGYPFGGDSSM